MEEINKIKEDLKKKRQIKNEISSLEKLLEDEFITHEQSIVVEKNITNLQFRLDEFQTRKKNKIDNSMFDWLHNIRVQSEDLENLHIEFIFEKLIVKKEITMFAAKPGGGKSLTTVAISNMSLQNKDVELVFYFDLDNSATTLKKRGIDKLIEKWGNSFQYISLLQKKNGKTISKKTVWSIIKKLQNSNLENTFIIFDSAKNFLESGMDRDKNKDVSPLLDLFKNLRNKGATVVFLHHTNKPQRDIETQFAGSSAWAEDASNAFILTQNQHKKSFIFTPIKNRIGDLSEVAYIYLEHKHELEEIDITFAKETQEDEYIKNEIIDFIISVNHTPIIYSDIMKHLTTNGYPNKDKVNRVIQQGKNIYWATKKIKEKNNRDVYTLIVSDNPDKSDR